MASLVLLTNRVMATLSMASKVEKFMQTLSANFTWKKLSNTFLQKCDLFSEMSSFSDLEQMAIRFSHSSAWNGTFRCLGAITFPSAEWENVLFSKFCHVCHISRQLPSPDTVEMNFVPPSKTTQELLRLSWQLLAAYFDRLGDIILEIGEKSSSFASRSKFFEHLVAIHHKGKRRME